MKKGKVIHKNNENVVEFNSQKIKTQNAVTILR